MRRVAAGCRAALLGAGRWLPWGRPRSKGRPKEPQVLAMVPQGPNRRVVEAIAEETGLAFTFANSCSTSHSGLAAIVIYDRDLSPVQWPRVIRALANNSPRPYIILLSSTVDANLWDELQRVGGCDVLRTPIVPETLRVALRRAWQLWRSLQRVRFADPASGDDPLAYGV